MKKWLVALYVCILAALVLPSRAFSQELADPEEDCFTLLVIGTNSQEEAGGDSSGELAQCIILMTINHPQSMVYFSTFRTDILMETEEGTACRLDRALGEAGPSGMEKMLENSLGVVIDNYAVISMKEVARVIGMEEFETVDVGKDGLAVLEQLVYSLNVGPGQLAGYVARLLPYVKHNVGFFGLFGLLSQIPSVVGYYSEEVRVPIGVMYQETQEGIVLDQETGAALRQTIYGR